MEKKDREPLQKELIIRAMNDTDETILNQLAKKGNGIYVSSHETLGAVTEEYHELIQAVRDNDAEAQYTELMDIAVACLVGMASIRSGKMHW